MNGASHRADDDAARATDALPFVAPCRSLPPSAPLRWLGLGWRDLRAAPGPSLALGTGITLLSAAICLIALRFGTGWLLLALLSAFVFVAPVLAIGVYAISAAVERGARPSLRDCLAATGRDAGDVLVHSLILLVISLVWIRAGSAVEIFFPDEGVAARAALLAYLAIGSVVGSVFALIAFAASAFALPMLVDRRTDAVTAAVTSVNAVLRNKRAMVVWATLIVASVAIGFATLLVGLAVTMPLIGHATWHAYRETIDASIWPAKH
ncbi:MAG: DUF2189 domain-containing protein [Proteobacteria bacterium]|nr:DUF2189 domain-containing protein [Pseudomonadota bacterium]